MMWGEPNSVTIVANSAQTAADVELASFLLVEHICCHCVPWERWKFLSGTDDWL